MADLHYEVEVEKDHLQKMAASKPIPALAELVWNALDADASRVDIGIEQDDVTMRAVTVSDNGMGMPLEDVQVYFRKLGGSWKAHGNRSKREKRILHGKEGKGRFKALGIGRVAEWTSVYWDGAQKMQLVVTIIRDNIKDVRVSPPQPVHPQTRTGVRVRITELDHDWRSLKPENSIQALAEIFAIYLTDYKETAIFVENEQVNPTAFIKSRASFSLTPIEADGRTYPVALDLIEWVSSSDRWIFFCGREGFPFQRMTPRFHAPGHQFSAYLKSDYVTSLQEQGTLDLVDLVAPLQPAIEECAEEIKNFFRQTDMNLLRGDIDQWKAEEIYPYSADPKDAIEAAERKVFDIVAINVRKHLNGFETQDKKAKAFQLRMLKQAIERGSDELQHILAEVLDLPEQTQKELSKLLEDTKLSNVISSAKLVADRLKFLHGLEYLLFDPKSRSLLRERSQLHKMIAENNTWIFGEQYGLTVSDQSLTEVLRKHRKLIGDEIVIDKPVKRLDGKVGIVDLMLSASIPQNRPDEREHLVVELKRPSVMVGADEITQIKRYAFTIASDERFSPLSTRWTFWVISNDLDAFGKAETRRSNAPRGQIYMSEDKTIVIWVKTWAEIIQECKSRLRFVQEKLQANVDSRHSLKYLQSTYEKYLGDFDVEEMKDGEDVDEAETTDEAAE